MRNDNAKITYLPTYLRRKRSTVASRVEMINHHSHTTNGLTTPWLKPRVAILASLTDGWHELNQNRINFQDKVRRKRFPKPSAKEKRKVGDFGLRNDQQMVEAMEPGKEGFLSPYPCWLRPS